MNKFYSFLIKEERKLETITNTRMDTDNDNENIDMIGKRIHLQCQ